MKIKYLNVIDFLKEPIFFYKFIGMEPCICEKSNSNSNYSKYLLYFSLGNLMVLAISQSIVVLKNPKNLLDATAAIPAVLFAIAIHAKILSIISRKKILTKLLYEIDRVFPKTKHTRLKFKFDKYVNEVRYVTSFVKYISFATATIFITFSLNQSIYEWIKIRKFKYRTPLVLWFSLDDISVVSYLLIYFNQSYGVHTINLGLLGTELLLFHLVMLLCMYFERTCTGFREFEEGSKGCDKFNQLRSLIQFHDIVLRMSSTVNDIFSVSVWFNIVIATFNLCLYAYQIVQGVSNFELLRYFMLFCYQIQQIAFPCYLGTRLINASTSVGLAAYDKFLLSVDRKYQKALLRVIERSQRAAILNAPAISVVSMITLKKVMSTAFKFFTLLNSLKTNK